MAEGYVFTSASDVNDLLNQIVSQAALHGWTQLYLDSFAGSGRRGHISRDGVVLNLCSMPGGNAVASGDNSQLNAIIPAADRVTPTYTWRAQNSGATTFYCPDVVCINASTGYQGSEPWYRQPGGDATLAATNQGRFRAIRAKGAIGKVHMFFFENPAAIYVWAEVRAGEWYWLAGGNLAKQYPFEGGQFYGASMADTNVITLYPRGFELGMAHRIPGPLTVPVNANGWASGYQTAPDRAWGTSTGLPANNQVPAYHMWTAGGARDDYVSEVQNRGYDMPTGRTWIHPPWVYARRLQGSEQVGLSYVGALPGAFFTTSEPYIGGEVITIGGVEYMVLLFNWRDSPWNTDLEGASALSGIWTRNNNFGSAIALRKPS